MTAASGPLAFVVLAAGQAKRYGGVKPLAPIGPSGEPPIDLVASDALAAGFTRVVLVVSPSTGPALRYHVRRRWPADVDVAFALQAAPGGTVDATLAAADVLDPSLPFAVGNADDVYGASALALVAEHLRDGDAAEHALVGFRLEAAVVGDSPVTRGVCVVEDGRLVDLEERRQVFAIGDGRFAVRDGSTPKELSGTTLVSMNLWGLRPGIWEHLRAAMAARRTPDAEVLLPEMVRGLVRSTNATFRVLPTDAPCVGVTHPDDLALVQAALAAQIARGVRPAGLWNRLA
jgi:hypothetical protein